MCSRSCQVMLPQLQLLLPYRGVCQELVCFVDVWLMRSRLLAW
jgi:hypothetical protein